MPRSVLLFVFGVLGFQQLPVLPASHWLLPLLAATGLLALSRRLRPLCFLLGGFAWSQLHALATVPAAIPGADRGVLGVVAEGVVVSLPERLPGRTRFELLANTLVEGDGQRATGQWRLRVNWRSAPDLVPGQRWRLPLRLKAVHGFASPGAWDYEGHLYRRGIRYAGYVASRDSAPVLLGEGTCCRVDRARDRLSRWIDSLQASAFARGVMRALVVADRSGLSAEARRLFRETGTSHLMAVSGLHIGLVAGAGMVVMSAAWRRVPALCQRVPARRPAVLFGLACATLYALLAGLQIPTQRALVMLLVYAAAFVARRRANPWHTLALACLAVLVLHPPSAVEAGFWLSFGAVAVITATLRHGQGSPRWLQAVRVQLALSLALWPVLRVFGMPAAVSGPVANLLLVPLFGLLVVPLSLGGTLVSLPFPALGAALLEPLGAGLDRLQPVLAFLAVTQGGLPGGVAEGMLLAVLLFATVLLLQPAGLPMRPLAVLLLVPLLPGEPTVPSGEFEVHVLDVGQGLSVVVETREHVLVYDTGPSYPSGFAASTAVLVPFLAARGVQRIDRLVLSHGDTDHAGGLAQLQRLVPIAEVLSGEPHRTDLAAGTCGGGQRWSWDGVRFAFLHPRRSDGLQGNNASCVLQVTNAAGSLLLTGDIEGAVESELVQRTGQGLASRVVVAPHHGSRSSSTARFVAETGADYVVYAAGWANRYGFPATTVAERWRAAGARAVNTATAGTVGFRFRRDGALEGPTGHRQAHGRYWSHGNGSAGTAHAVSSAN